MLDTIKQYINTLPNIPFSEYYQGYICRIQDHSLELETSDLKKFDVSSINKLIHRLHQELETES